MKRLLLIALLLISYQGFTQENTDVDNDDNKSVIQEYTPSILLKKGQWDIKWFNNLYTETRDLFGPKAASHVRVLYGGSVNDHNAHAFLSLDGCDGALVGGASLNAHSFAQIVEVAFRIQQERTK